MKRSFISLSRLVIVIALAGGMLHNASRPALAATQINITGPAGSVRFGTKVYVLPNGNLIITDPNFNGGLGVDVGAVYLYNGKTGTIISMLTGMTAGDQVGSGGVSVLSNGNYLIHSPNWDNGSATNAGAVTWGSSVSGVSGVVSAANSLVGSTSNDKIGSTGITGLNNGNYVVGSYLWDNGAIVDAGAVTWGNGSTGISGAVSASNSLVGSAASDKVGLGGAVTLSNGNYVVSSYTWDNGAIVDAGAATWANGSTGITGPVSAANSLVGSSTSDQVGGSGITALSNGNYVVRSAFWNNGAVADAGAVTWGNGASGVSGAVSVANSLVGNKLNDRVGVSGILTLNNGNYVVVSPQWSNGAITGAGAVTWGNGTSGTTGLVSTINSLVGSTAGDNIGSGGVVRLNNDFYVVYSPNWDNGAIVNVGAVTWGNGATGITGTVSPANSLVGSTAEDKVGSGGVTALTNGNYVVRSPYWDNGAIAEAGAVTWGNGATGITGAVSPANSLVGGSASDFIGQSGITALSNGNYVVSSYLWDNGGIGNSGAVTWGNGTTGITGAVTPANSLVGSAANDYIGSNWFVALPNGSFVVCSPFWDNGGISNAGAVTWGSGTSGITGAVSPANSLVGSTAGDQLGYPGVGIKLLTNGNYVVRSPDWDNGGIADAGAVTWGNGATGITGAVSPANSLVGGSASDKVGEYGVTTLNNGNYVVNSPYWDNGGIVDAGAVTWGNSLTGISGVASPANSLVGSIANDQIGINPVTALSNGDYVANGPYWDNGITTDAGAVTWGFGMSGVVGLVNGNSSVMGGAAGGGGSLVFAYDPFFRQIVVGRPYENIVTILKLPYVFLPYLVR